VQKVNVINVKIDFTQGYCQTQGISVVTGDYASTKVKFTFDESAENGILMFEMKNPRDELVYADEIVNNEVVLVGQVDVKDDNGYIKYLDDNDTVYWYDSANNVLYNSNYEEVTGVELDTLTKQTQIASLFGEEGDYTFEVSLYKENSKLTSVCDYITANKEQVIVDGEKTQESITILDNLLNDLSGKIVETNNLNINAVKEGRITTVTITHKDGTTSDVSLEDGKSIEYRWEGTSLGIRQEGQSEYQYENLKGDKGEAGAIKMQIVAELPETGQDDTIYLVPLEEPESQENRYAEYVWINGEWELLGKIGIEVDLTDYYTKTETNNLLATKQALITNDNKLSASLVSGLSSVATSGSYNDLSNTPDLSVYELSSNKVTSLSSASTDTQYPSAKCVYDLIGNLETILTTLDVGGGAS